MNQRIVLVKYATDKVTPEHCRIEDIPIPQEQELEEGEVVVEVHAISVDPYMRARFREGLKGYLVGPFEVNQPLNGGGLGKVIASKDSNLHVGDYVAGHMSWQKYVKAKASTLQKAPPSDDKSLYYKFLPGLNITPLSAYLPIRQLWPRETVPPGSTAYVSGAAGGVGMVAGQILKNVYGCRVIGSAGSDAKVAFLKEKLGFDEAFNYKSDPPAVALPRLAPNGIHLFFDNVGGTTLDAALGSMVKGGRILACGSIEEYDRASDQGTNMKNLFQIVVKTLTVQGFLLNQFQSHFEEGTKELMAFAKEGKLKTEETFFRGLESAPTAFMGLFQGANTGKTLVLLQNESGNE